jgi:hypothetical protein
MLKIKNRVIIFMLITAVTCLTGIPVVYGAAGADWWGDFDAPIRGGVDWNGVASSVFEVVDVSSLPDGLTPSAGPADPDFYNDLVVRVKFTVTLESTARGSTSLLTLSGIGEYTDATGRTYNHFYLIADGQLITMAFVQFLRDQFADSSSPLYGGAFTNADGDPSAYLHSNVIPSTSVTGPGLQPGEPLYSSVRIEIQTP